MGASILTDIHRAGACLYLAGPGHFLYHIFIEAT